MTELMKRFQEETGIDIFGGWSYQIVNGLMTPPLSESPWMKFIQWLCDKLTWRPVSEKPEKDGEYFTKHDTSDEPSVLSYKDGVWLFFDYDIAENVITNPPLYWLPIPPAPKGEVK